MSKFVQLKKISFGQCLHYMSFFIHLCPSFLSFYTLSVPFIMCKFNFSFTVSNLSPFIWSSQSTYTLITDIVVFISIILLFVFFLTHLFCASLLSCHIFINHIVYHHIFLPVYLLFIHSFFISQWLPYSRLFQSWHCCYFGLSNPLLWQRPWVLQNVQQHPWIRLTRYLLHPSPSCDIQKSLQYGQISLLGAIPQNIQHAFLNIEVNENNSFYQFYNRVEPWNT